MKRNAYRTILVFIALTMFGAADATARTQHQSESGDKKVSPQTSKKGQENLPYMPKIDVFSLMPEPHQVLATAYRQNIRTFTKALLDQAQIGGSLSADFARAAVTEINRNFDQAKDHHNEHVKTMSADLRSKAAAMIKEMDTHHSRLRNAIDALEKDVENYTLNSNRIAIDSADVIRHLDEISKMHNRE